MSETADTQAHLDIQNTADDRIAQLDRILEAILLASEQPLPTEQLQRMLGHDLGVTKKDIRDALERLNADLAPRAAELAEVSSGWRIQVKREYAEWVGKLYQEKPPRLSRALLETLALICYRQPITRGEIEDVRGVAMSPNIIRTLLDRGWIREVGVKEVPGRPSLFGTTHQLLDDLNLRTLDDLPSLPEIKDPQQLETALARLGEQLHEVPALEGALEEESGDDGETPSAAAALADDAPVRGEGEGEESAASAAPHEAAGEEAPADDDGATPSEPAADVDADDSEADGDEPDASRKH